MSETRDSDGRPPRRYSRLRTAAALAVLGRVAGPDPVAANNAIHGPVGPRWFAPDSAMVRVHGDGSMFVGGVRALLLQSLHPSVMAAVAEHSGYQSDPWGRLQRTATFLAETTFGTAENAERAVRIVRARHKRVTGTTPDGVAYEASDPRLLLWVHVAEVDSFLLAHQTYGRKPLDAAGCDEFVAQSALVAGKLGVVDAPTTSAELEEALRGFEPDLQATPGALVVADFLRHGAPLPLAAKPAYSALVAAAIAMMPDWSRAPLGLPSRPVLERTLIRGGGRVVTSGIRWALDAVPPATPGQAPVDPAGVGPR